MNEKMLIHILKADYRYYKSEIKKHVGEHSSIYITMCTGKIEYIKELLIGLLSDSEIAELDETLFIENTNDDFGDYDL